MAYFASDPSAQTPPSGGGSSDLLSQYAAQAGITLGQTQGPSTGSSTSLTNPGGLIWMGMQKTREHAALDKFIVSKTDRTLTYAQVMTNFDKLSHDEQRQMAGYLALAGYLTTGSDSSYKDVAETAAYAPLGAVRDAYENLIKDTVARQRNLSQKVTPIQMLKQSIAYRLQGDGLKWDGNLDSLDTLTGVGPGKGKKADQLVPKDGDKKTLTQTSHSVDIMDPQDAKGLTRAMLQNELGRDPTQAEYEDFIAMLQHAQRANPSSSTTTQNMVYDSQAGGWRTASDSTTTHQGIGSQGLEQMAYEKAQQNPDYAEWQAMGTYAPALFDALGATVPGVGN